MENEESTREYGEVGPWEARGAGAAASGSRAGKEFCMRNSLKRALPRNRLRERLDSGPERWQKSMVKAREAYEEERTSLLGLKVSALKSRVNSHD